MTTFTVELESDYIRMGDSRRPTPSHRLDAYCTVILILRVSYEYGYTRGSGRVWVEIFGAGRERVRVASSATGTGRVAEMVDPHTPSLAPTRHVSRWMKSLGNGTLHDTLCIYADITSWTVQPRMHMHNNVLVRICLHAYAISHCTCVKVKF